LVASLYVEKTIVEILVKNMKLKTNYFWMIFVHNLINLAPRLIYKNT
jgi:hypothetical protein